MNPNNTNQNLNFVLPNAPKHQLGPTIPFANQTNINLKAKELIQKKEAEMHNTSPPPAKKPITIPPVMPPAVKNLIREVDKLKEEVNIKLVRVAGRHEGLLEFLMKKVIMLENHIYGIQGMKTTEELTKRHHEMKPKKESKRHKGSTSETEDNN